MTIDKQTYFDVIRLIFENSADGICIIDVDGIIQWHNKTFQNIFLLKDNEAINNSVNIVMPEVIAKKHDAYIQKYLATGKSSIIGTGREVIAKNAKGTLFSIYLSISESFVAGSTYFIGVMHKTTISHEDIENKVDNLEKLMHEWQHRT
jgi:PAS domain S-box-containing protein